MNADAIVVTHRSSDVIRQCVISLRSDPSIDRIIVVNNSGGDATLTALQSVEDVIYLETPSNIGFGSAVNFARLHVAAPYVVLANPDTTQASTTTSALLRFIGDHPRCAIVGPAMVTPAGDLDRNSQHDLSLVRMLFQAIGWPESFQVMRPRAEHFGEHRTDCLIGAFVLCRIEALDEIGWFDESIFLFGEDQDLCRRLRTAKWEVWFAPVGRVEHLDGHSWRQLTDQGRQLFQEARYRELRKAGGAIEAEAYRALANARDTVRKIRR